MPLPLDSPKADLELTDQFLDCRGMFEALTDPQIISASQLTQLQDDEEVLGLSINGVHRAYPSRFIAWHHIVNDVVGGLPVAVSYCMICNTGIAFDATVAADRALFNVFGLYRGVLAMCSKDANGNDTIWTHMDGEAIAGASKGKELKPIALLNTTWGEWKKLHPDTTTPSWDTGYEGVYNVKMVSGELPIPSMFDQTMRGLKDERLPQNTLLVALKIDATTTRAYPQTELAAAGGVVQEVVGTQPTVVFFVEKTGTGAAFDSRLEGAVIEFALDPTDETLFVDRATGSRFTIEGQCVSGKLAGKQLVALTFLQSRWYGWSALFPKTTIFAARKK